ncbi:519_t:CDS:1, partial [Paraglomus occultum]
SKRKIDRQNVRPGEWIKTAPDAPYNPTGNSTKVMYRSNIPRPSSR